MIKYFNSRIKKLTRLNNKKLFSCKVCGKKFELLKKNKYIVQENKGLSAMANGCKRFECFNCPKCGCQNIVNVREG